jgi:hypothetical protein
MDDELCRAPYLPDSATENYFYSGGAAFGFEHFQDVLRGAVAEELAQRFLVIGNAMFLDQGDEIRRRESGQCGFREVRICRNEMFRWTLQVGEITPSAAGDQDLLAGTIRALEDRDAPPAFAGLDCAHEPRGPGAQNYRIIFVDHNREARSAERAAYDYYIPAPTLLAWRLSAAIAAAGYVLEFLAFAIANIEFVDWTLSSVLAKVIRSTRIAD